MVFLFGNVEKKLYLYIKILVGVTRPPPAYYRNITYMSRGAPYDLPSYLYYKVTKNNRHILILWGLFMNSC